LQGILTNAEAYLGANDVDSARNEMTLFFETLTENSTSISENALKETGIVGDCLLARKMQSDPVVDAGTDQTFQLGTPVTINATYTDADNTENHSARIDWGDGIVEDVPVTMTGPGAGEVTGEHTYVNAENYTVEICVTDLYGAVGCDTLTIEVNAFPSTSILDDFNRANGGIGSAWSGNTAGYNIASNQLSVDYNGTNNNVIYWTNEPFGANQEAYVTFTQVDPAGDEQILLLKSQSNITWGEGVLQVVYDALNNRAQVVTWDWPQGWVQHGADIPVTFANGDTLGARAFADGTVEVYKNGTLLATRDITSWPHYADGGYIGLWFIDADNAALDDFGGGTVPNMEVVELSTLDDFNRASGAIGGNWSGASNKYSLASNQLQAGSTTYGNEIYWNPTAFDVDQEVHFTFTQLHTSATAQGLVLKAQSIDSSSQNSSVQVVYVASLNVAQVWTYTPAQGLVQRGQNIPVTFANGDHLSVRAYADGMVEVYKNGILFGRRDITAWPYYANGGYIGVGFVGASGAKVDDFGGGTLTSGMQSLLAGGGESSLAAASSESIEADPWNVEFSSAGQFWQGVPLGTNQTASLTVTNTQTNLRPKPESNGVWGEGTVQVLYDVPNQSIQVWEYDTVKGWQQVGKDISSKFTTGDVFTARVLPDGTLELSRNGKLLAKRKVGQ